MIRLMRKYILMTDIRQTNIVSHIIYLFFFTVPTILFVSVITVSSFVKYNYDFDRLMPLNGIVQVESYNIVYKKSGTVKPVVDISVLSGSKKIPYQVNAIDSSDQIFQQQHRINNQPVTIWYLPQNNQFYLIRFQNISLNTLAIAQYTRQQLLRKVFYNKYILPELSLSLLLLILCVQLYLIRNFLVKYVINDYQFSSKVIEKVFGPIIIFALYLGTPIAATLLLSWLSSLVT